MKAFENGYKSIKLKTRRDVLERFLKISAIDKDNTDLSKAAQTYLDIWQVRPEFKIISGKREDLQSGPLIIFSNHPGNLDLSLILSSVNRMDIKVLVNRFDVDLYRKFWGNEHFIPAETSPKKLLSLFQHVKSYVSQGGAFLIFPTKTDERKTGELRFHSGLQHIIESADLGWKVASIYIDTQQELAVLKNKHAKARALKVALASKVPLKNNKTYPISVTAKIQSVAHWRELLRGVKNHKDRNEVLVNEYKSDFKLK